MNPDLVARIAADTRELGDPFPIPRCYPQERAS
jgi:hypothetical protein